MKKLLLCLFFNLTVISLNAAEIPNPVEDISEYEAISLVDQGDQIIKDAQACLQESKKFVQQLKNPPAGIVASAVSYAASYFYATPSPDTMIERINTSLTQLERLREYTVVMLRRATDARSFEKDVVSTLQANMKRIGNLDSKKIYAYLFDPTGADNDETVKRTTQKGIDSSAAHIKELIDEELGRDSTSDARKNLLRQIGFLLRNDASKQEYDAYLTGTLATLIFDEKTKHTFEQRYMEILQLKAELDEQKDRLAKLKAKPG